MIRFVSLSKASLKNPFFLLVLKSIYPYLGTGLKKQEDKIKEKGFNYGFATEEQNVIHAGLIGQLAEYASPVDPDDLLPKYLRRTQAEVDWHKKTGKPFGSDSDYVEEV